jgi:hypothetical protein
MRLIERKRGPNRQRRGEQEEAAFQKCLRVVVGGVVFDVRWWWLIRCRRVPKRQRAGRQEDAEFQMYMRVGVSGVEYGKDGGG